MNYKEAIDWLYSFEKHGIKLGLERINHICKKLGNPQNNYKIVHVGGTNGKGSVCKFISSILISEGYTVGVYTSPHIQRFSERFVIDNDEISEIEIILLVEKIKPIVEEMIQKENTPTFFEITTAIAFEYFYNKKIDYAIIEAGLGGRFDATNIVKPLVSIITNVSLEHQNRLGDTLEKIAFEKAGIIKENTPVITAAKDKTVSVIKNIASKKNASLTVLDSKNWEKTEGGIDWQSFTIHGKLKDYHVKTFLPGFFQGENIAVAIACIETLQMNGVFITEGNINEGIEKTINPGRMEIVSFEPLILLDGAHNIDGIINLKKTLEKDFVYEKLILIFGILSDKSVKEIIDVISPLADYIVFTKSKNSRALEPEKLIQLSGKKDAVIKANIFDAIEQAKKLASKKDIIVVSGSLFTVGEARDYFVKA